MGAAPMTSALTFSDEGWMKWRKLSFLVALPAVFLGNVNAFLPKEGHEAHKRPDFIPYEYLRLRYKVRERQD